MSAETPTRLVFHSDGGNYAKGALVLALLLVFPGAAALAPAAPLWARGLWALVALEALVLGVLAFRLRRCVAAVLDAGARELVVTRFRHVWSPLASLVERVDRLPLECVSDVLVVLVGGGRSRVPMGEATTSKREHAWLELRLGLPRETLTLASASVWSRARLTERALEVATLLQVPLHLEQEDPSLEHMTAERRARYRPTSRQAPEEQFANLVVAALLDGQLDEAERQLLGEHARRLGLEAGEAQRILAEVQASPTRGVAKPVRPADRQRAFQDIVEVLRADGVLHPREQRVIRILGEKLGASEEDVARALAPSAPAA